MVSHFKVAYLVIDVGPILTVCKPARTRRMVCMHFLSSEARRAYRTGFHLKWQSPAGTFELTSHIFYA